MREVASVEVRLASISERIESFQRDRQHIGGQIEADRHERTVLVDTVTRDQADIERLEQEGKQAEQERLEALEAYEHKRGESEKLREEHDEQISRISEAEKGLKLCREAREAILTRLNEIRMQVSEERMKADHLVEQIQDRYGLSLHEAALDPENRIPEEETQESLAEKLAILREKMAKIGDVNLAAIDELSQLKERFAFLKIQKADLERSIESLTVAIRKINATTRERFASTFSAVNEKFQRIFPRVFRGGKGKLVLTKPEDLLETGIDIVAQPPGKRLQNINLLSGGEKALTAIALMFAIFEHRVPPFCVLDEVDAPLDDQNTQRFLWLVKEMSKQTQFILITHNKGTMEVANNMYGITMEDPGVSRLVSVKMAQKVEVTQAPAEPDLEQESRSVA